MITFNKCMGTNEKQAFFPLLDKLRVNFVYLKKKKQTKSILFVRGGSVEPKDQPGRAV